MLRFSYLKLGPEIGDGGIEPLGEGDGGLPGEVFLSEGDIWLALAGIVAGQGVEVEL